jgi:hypothetical protein
VAKQLRGKPPTTDLVTKPKLIVFGPPGIGKTWVSLDFPKVYYIDTEGGATERRYQRKLEAGGGVYFGKADGANFFPAVVEELNTLATVKHDYLTVVIDSFSKLYNNAAAVAETKVGSDFGKDKKEANKPTRQLMLAIERLDMNVVLVCHQKEKWAKDGDKLFSMGPTFDGFDKLEYDLDLCLHIQPADRSAVAVVTKTRLEHFPRWSEFPWSFAEFEKRAGANVMLRPPKPFVVATPEQVAEVTRLLDSVKVSEDWGEKCLAKAGVERWEEMDGDTIAKCIKYLGDVAAGKAAK